MFERRLKVFLGVLLIFTAVLVLRAAHVQVLQHDEWTKLAAETMTRTDLVQTSRGEILDRKGNRLAIDEPCVDVAVDYRALTPEPDAAWVRNLALLRLKERPDGAWAAAARDRRKTMLADEIKKIRDDIEQMWPRLAKVDKRPLAEIEEARRTIVEKVRMRRRYIWYSNYERALRNHKKGVDAAATQPASVWKRWLLDDDPDAPDVDHFELDVSDERARHVLLRGVSTEVQTELTTYIDRFPGLAVRFSTRRVYPYGEAATHVVGRMAKVMREDMVKAGTLGDELRQYEPNDLIGRGGVEAMCEKVLRGVRGRVQMLEGRKVAAIEPEPGKDVKVSIDVELQQDVQLLFKAVPVKARNLEDKDVVKDVPMQGAAVVIDVATGEVLAMASAPSYDPNRYNELYSELSDPRNLDIPLLNRATQAQREPGSTVKPIVGLAGVAQNIRRVDEGFECTGYMVVNGTYYYGKGRCWVNSMFHDALCPQGRACRQRPCPAVAHHPIPWAAKHPTGRLTLADAIERSCNPYFETIAHSLRAEGLSDWFRMFGMGERTHIGIAEAKGLVPRTDNVIARSATSMFSTWSAGIGQGAVHATPLQMANVAATLARGGVWVRPRLIHADSVAAVGPITQEPDRRDLGLPPAAIKAVRDGMVRVVNSRAGSGNTAKREDMLIAGKTGSATAAPITLYVYDPVTRRKVRGEDGRFKREVLRPSTHWDPNPLAPWYYDTGKEGSEKPTLTHSWFMGYAPADKPQIAFAVLVEYGGGGGAAAGAVSKKLIDLCVTHGHLKVPGKPATNVARGPEARSSDASTELLHVVR